MAQNDPTLPHTLKLSLHTVSVLNSRWFICRPAQRHHCHHRDSGGVCVCDHSLRCLGGRCRRRGSCPRWWPCWGRDPGDSGPWRSFLGGRRRIPGRGGSGKRPTCPADRTPGLRTAENDRKKKKCSSTGSAPRLSAIPNMQKCVTLAKLAVNRTHSNSSPILFRNSSTWGRFRTYTWKTGQRAVENKTSSY